MAIIIEANYSKKLGLPQYSSHQYSVTVRTEISDLSQLAKASSDLYVRLQDAVDTQIANPGFVPGAASPAPVRPQAQPPQTQAPAGVGERWKCSDRQRDLILKIVDEHKLAKGDVEALARERFGVGVLDLNKAQASGLIDELLEVHGKSGRGDRRGSNRGAFAGRGSR